MVCKLEAGQGIVSGQHVKIDTFFGLWGQSSIEKCEAAFGGLLLRRSITNETWTPFTASSDKTSLGLELSPDGKALLDNMFVFSVVAHVLVAAYYAHETGLDERAYSYLANLDYSPITSRISAIANHFYERLLTI